MSSSPGRAGLSSFQASIYADTRLTVQEIAACLAATLRGSVEGALAGTVVAERIELDVTTLDQRPPSNLVDGENVFLSFPYVIEVFTGEPFDHEALVADVTLVLGALDQLGVRYVTAADFEDALPGGGRSRT